MICIMQPCITVPVYACGTSVSMKNSLCLNDSIFVTIAVSVE